MQFKIKDRNSCGIYASICGISSHSPGHGASICKMRSSDYIIAKVPPIQIILGVHALHSTNGFTGAPEDQALEKLIVRQGP